jgi:purine nucleosidase
MEKHMTPLILDTDIGTDVDDIVALGLLLRAPAVDLRAVTTVYADAALRARMVKAVLAAADRPAVPVGCGVDQPLMQRDPIFWQGWEGEGILDAADPPEGAFPHAVDLLTEMVLAEPGAITVVAVGPLTNIALAITKEPRFATAVRRITIMGGIIQRRHDQLSASYVEHNIRCDPEAAQIVLTSGAPITLVPLDVTTQVQITRQDLRRLATDRLGAMLADQLDRYMTHVGRDWTHPHDPLAAATVIRPDFVQTQPMHVVVETDGRHTRGETVAKLAGAGAKAQRAVDVALTVEAKAFERWLIPHLAGSDVDLEGSRR